MHSDRYKYYKGEAYNRNTNQCFLIVCFLIVIFFILTAITYASFNVKYGYITIENVSMQPTLNPTPLYDGDGEVVQDSVFIERTTDVTYGDIVIVDRSQETGQRNYTVIKRVMALEGDKICLAMLPVGEAGEYEMRFIRIKADEDIDEIVYTGTSDEHIIYEDYIKSYSEWSSQARQEYYGSPYYYDAEYLENYIEKFDTEIINVIVGDQTFQLKFFTVGSNKDASVPDQVFCMGDNRLQSEDSRKTGTASQTNIVGKVISIIRNGNAPSLDFFSWARVLGEYLRLIFEEIIAYFTV